MALPGAQPVSIRITAETVVACPGCDPAAEIVVQGRRILELRGTVCAHLVANLAPLLDAAEAGVDPEALGLFRGEGRFRCGRTGCDGTFRVQAVQRPHASVTGDAPTRLKTPISCAGAMVAPPPLLRRLDLPQAQALLRGAEALRCEAGRIAIPAGQTIDALWILQSGEAREGPADAPQRRRPGDLLAPEAMLGRQALAAPISAATACTFWRVPTESLAGLLQNRHDLRRELSQAILADFRARRIPLQAALTRAGAWPLALIRLRDLLEGLAAEGTTGLLRVGASGEAGFLTFASGEIVEASDGASTGETALARLLSRDIGEVRLQDAPDRVRSNVERPLREILQAWDHHAHKPSQPPAGARNRGDAA